MISKDRTSKPPARIAVFASGSGSNMQRIAEYFQVYGGVEIASLYCNRPDAFVLKRAEQLKIPAVIFTKNDFYLTEKILADLNSKGVEWIVLAGFLWLIPDDLIRAYPNKIINIHPALLPKYGGKGMYGHKVHEAVIAHRERESGITIHYVNEHYDEGQIIFQAKCFLEANETPTSLAQKVHALEYAYFPEVISNVIAK